MPKYFYTAKSLKGETKTGVLLAKDVHQLARKLREEDFLLIKAIPEGGEKKTFAKFFSGGLFFFRGVSWREKVFFTRNLQVMIAAGFSLPKALGTLALQTKSQKFKKALTGIKEEIIKGKTFSDSLSRYPRIFPPFFQSMIKVGEETGTLDEVLRILSQQMEKEYGLKSRVKGAMIYPAVIISAMIGIGILMLIMVVPKLADTFEQLDIELPATTKFIIGLGTFLAEKWYLVVLAVIIVIIFLSLALKSEKGKRIIDNIVLKLPVISPIVKKTNSAYTVRGLSSLTASGVPIVKSLEIVSGTLGNIYFQEALKEAAEKVRKGGKLSEALKPYQSIYSLTVIQMIAVGEETGETSQVLSKLADFFEEEVGRATENLTAVIEPVLMLIVGAMVGFFAISMVQPIYSMVQGF